MDKGDAAKQAHAAPRNAVYTLAALPRASASVSSTRELGAEF